MERDALETVLRLHQMAYELLLWLDMQSARDPSVFSPEASAELSDGSRCATWLAAHRESLPAQALPAASEMEAFAFLLASFFDTSFRVQRQELGGKILEARLVRGTIGRDTGARRRSSGSVMFHALRRLATAEGMPMDSRTAGRIADRATIRSDLLIWTYGVELVRRATRQSKGPAVHGIWQAMDPEVRRNLTADTVWESRERLLAVIRDTWNRNRIKE
jgi:hypothetical protein